MSEPTGFPDNESVIVTNVTNSNRSTQYNQTVFDYYTEQIAEAANVYYTPILVALGTIGNFISIFVFCNSKLRLQSTSQYLTALAVSDSIFLFQLLPPWLNAVQATDLFTHPGFCQVFVYFSYVSCCFSAWLVVAFTVERFVAVLYPLQRNAICSVTRSRHIIGAISLSALLLNTPVLRFATTNNDCNIDVEYMDYAARFNMVDTIISFTVPLFVITGLNTWIMIGVWRLERARHRLMKADLPAPAVACRHVRRVRVMHGPRSQQRVTRMLLIVSTVFVVLNMPAYTMRLVAYAYDFGKGDNGRWAALQQITLSFFNTNFGINFILYCMSGQNFRRALRQSVPWLTRRARRAEAIRRVTSFTNPARASSISTSCMSTCTEATNNHVVVTQHRRHEEAFITRWTFDNSRQRLNQRQMNQQRHNNKERIEMPTYPGTSNM